MLPKRRKKDLLVEELPGETIVYDTVNHKVHCLNPTTALIWRHCDGKTTLPALTTLLHEKLNLPADPDIAWTAILQLDKARLLQESAVPPREGECFSRRDLARKLGAAAILAPVILSIAAPPAAAASSLGAPCTKAADCNSGICCASNNGSNKCSPGGGATCCNTPGGDGQHGVCP
jgi:hypothetical protein